MNSALALVEFESVITWPVRAALVPFSCGLQAKHPATAKISFPTTYPVAEDVILSGVAWTEIEFRWRQPFDGGRTKANEWLHSPNGETEILSKLEKLSALLVDAIRVTHSNDRNLAVLRSFGIRDWPYYEFGVAGEKKQIRIGVHAEAQFRSVPTELFDGRQVSLTRSASFPSRAMLRASDLAEGGYPTEAVLIAFAALDAAVQAFLISALEAKGISKDAAEGMLRNITTKRLSTYLDGMLNLVCGRSLAENKVLFKAMLDANSARNDAIHNGVELDRLEAKKILDSIAGVFLFLRSVHENFEPGLQKPVFFC